MKHVKAANFSIQNDVKISELPTRIKINRTKKEIEKELIRTRIELGKLQDTLYAHGKYAVLVCLQGMDTAGKDSLIREVFKDFNARGVVVHSFKVPTDLERKHDYLWRHYIALPERGKFGVFNRTHYENVLVTRVHPNYILGELLPNVNDTNAIDEAFWDKRFEQINAFEQTIAQNGTLIFKFFLNLSKEEQRRRLLRRLDKVNKNWKFSPGDLEERKLWNTYMECYQDILNRTSKPHARWYSIPADNKGIARLAVATILFEELSKYKDIKEPELEEDIKIRVSEYRNQLENE